MSDSCIASSLSRSEVLLQRETKEGQQNTPLRKRRKAKPKTKEHSQPLTPSPPDAATTHYLPQSSEREVTQSRGLGKNGFVITLLEEGKVCSRRCSSGRRSQWRGARRLNGIDMRGLVKVHCLLTVSAFSLRSILWSRHSTGIIYLDKVPG
jgi:hypothetical protein